MSYSLEIPWLVDPLQRQEQRLARGQPPQALLVHGPAGVGRRHFSLALAASLLGSSWRPPTDADPHALPPVPHADFLQLGIEEKKTSIAVEQVRELIEFLSLTSHQGGRKVGLIFPAEALQRSAANSLLKTLEEPPGRSTLILVAENPARLPPTVRSRCERIRLLPPPVPEGLAWLAGVPCTGSARSAALAFAGGAPLAARAVLRDGFADLSAELAGDVNQLLAKETPPTAVAKRWARLDVPFCHRWLYWVTAGLVRRAMAAPGTGPATGEVPLKIADPRLNMRACFAYLDRLAQARRLEGWSLNHEAQFAELLVWWYGGQGASR